jgi:hypothetical protein
LGDVPESIVEGDVIRVRLLFFGFLPAWKHEIRILEVDEQGRRIVTMEHGGAVKKWNHVILVELAGAGRTRYTERRHRGRAALTGDLAVRAVLLPVPPLALEKARADPLSSRIFLAGRSGLKPQIT